MAPGCCCSFAALGGVMLTLRETGHLVGWGFQFQSPVFVVLMARLLFAVGLSFSGVIAPGGRWAGWGQSFAARGGIFGSLCTGVLAAVVGDALHGALHGRGYRGRAVGSGSGGHGDLPGARPRSGTALRGRQPRAGDRPSAAKAGRVDGGIGQALAFPVYASVLWLVWVASREGGDDLLLAAGGGMLLIAFAAWVRRSAAGWRLLSRPSR